jgi:hypothetical protein
MVMVSPVITISRSVDHRGVAVSDVSVHFQSVDVIFISVHVFVTRGVLVGFGGGGGAVQFSEAEQYESSASSARSAYDV